MFCPECLYEYEKDIKKCPDCGVDLVKELPDEDEGTMPDIETAELTQVEDEIEAGIIRGMLEEAGIFSFLKVNVLLNTNLIMGGIFGRRKFGSVIINKEDMEKAKAVLDDFKKSR